jgi:hypothetical protein
MRQKIRAPRYEVGLSVVFETERGVWSGTVVDMSESGILVSTEKTLAPGTEVTLVPNVENDAELPAEMRAVVERSGDIERQGMAVRGIAFRLVGLSIQHFAQVREYLRRQGSRKR